MTDAIASYSLVAMTIVLCALTAVVWMQRSRLRVRADERDTAEARTYELQGTLDKVRAELRSSRAAMVSAQLNGDKQHSELARLRDELERVRYLRDCAEDALGTDRVAHGDHRVAHGH